MESGEILNLGPKDLNVDGTPNDIHLSRPHEGY